VDTEREPMSLLDSRPKELFLLWEAGDIGEVKKSEPNECCRVLKRPFFESVVVLFIELIRGKLDLRLRLGLDGIVLFLRGEENVKPMPQLPIIPPESFILSCDPFTEEVAERLAGISGRLPPSTFFFVDTSELGESGAEAFGEFKLASSCFRILTKVMVN